MKTYLLYYAIGMGVWVFATAFLAFSQRKQNRFEEVGCIGAAFTLIWPIGLLWVIGSVLGDAYGNAVVKRKARRDADA